MVKTLSILFGLLFGLKAFAQSSHQATSEELEKLYSQPSYSDSRFYMMDDPEWQPSMDVAKFKYVLFTGSPTNAEALQLKHQIAINLPTDMKIVVLVTPSTLDYYKTEYKQLGVGDKVVFATSNNATGGAWARDAFPVPVVHKDKTTTLVGATYFRTFDGNAPIAGSINFNIKQYNFTFVGGNILADEKGTCFVVQSSRLFNTTEADLKSAYGCKGVHFMKYVAGIGDIDEVLKPIGKNTILTNAPEYVDQLKSWGYNVAQLPDAKSPGYPNRTYANSLVLNGTVFMPVYGQAADNIAAGVYEKLGYKVVRITSNDLSDNYSGSVHCQTMAYPSMNQADLFSVLHLQAL